VRLLRSSVFAVASTLSLACSSGSSSSSGPAPGAHGGNVAGPSITLPTGNADTITEITSFGANPGQLKMYAHAPPKPAAEPAVVLALHGCTESAHDYVSAGWNTFADAYGFYVVYAEQTTANDASHCFHWYLPEDTKRGAGEAASLAAMVDYAKAQFGANRAFVTGLSAGAAMTAVMLATYPDLFEGGAIMAGLPYGCASSQVDAFSCMNPGKQKSGSEWAALVHSAAPGPAPRVQIWHGSSDYTVRPQNLTELTKQWTSVNGASDTPSATATEGKATRREFKNAQGEVRVETFEVAGMGHGTAIASKGEGGVPCGKVGAFIVEEALCSTAHAARFFGIAH